MAENFYTIKNERDNLRLQKTVAEMPPFIMKMVQSKRGTVADHTLLEAVREYRLFFLWLISTQQPFKEMSLTDIAESDMKHVNRYTIDDYLYAQSTAAGGKNRSASLNRKLSLLNVLWRYLCARNEEMVNPCANIESWNVGKTKQQDYAGKIDILTAKMEASLFGMINDESLQCGYFSPTQVSALRKTRERDAALVSLLLSTGITLTETVALNLRDWEASTSTLYLPDGRKLPVDKRAADYLSAYMPIRLMCESCESTDALFMSLQKKRMCERAIENMTAKFGYAAGIPFKITPQVLRDTFGKRMFESCGNIADVGAALGTNNFDMLLRRYNF